VTVVGNRWPVRDEDAAFMLDAFYRAAADGATLAAALQRARVAAIETGRPPAVWAGLVLLGEGDVRLAPVPRQTDWTRRAAAVLLAAVVLAMTMAATRKGRGADPTC
jgi:hypothetical protein